MITRTRKNKSRQLDLSERTDVPGYSPETVEELSNKLNAALNEPAPRKDIEFEEENFPKAWQDAIDEVHQIDNPAALYRKLRESLLLPNQDDLFEYPKVAAVLRRAEHYAHAASCLARAAKLEDDKFARRAEEQLEIVRTTARDELESEKSAGRRTKSPTIQDIEDRMISGWGKEVNRIRDKKAELHSAFRIMEALEKDWTSRCETLRVLARGAAKTRFESGES